jgi:hypothetical protein
MKTRVIVLLAAMLEVVTGVALVVAPGLWLAFF